jgi:hypothetical protein
MLSLEPELVHWETTVRGGTIATRARLRSYARPAHYGGAKVEVAKKWDTIEI